MLFRSGLVAIERISGCPARTSSSARFQSWIRSSRPFTPKEKANKVAIHVDLAGWKFPANLEVQIEQDRIYVEMSLIELTDASTVDSKELLKLLEKNDAVAGYVFAYDSNAKLIQLR